MSSGLALTSLDDTNSKPASAAQCLHVAFLHIAGRALRILRLRFRQAVFDHAQLSAGFQRAVEFRKSLIRIIAAHPVVDVAEGQDLVDGKLSSSDSPAVPE